MGTLIKRLFKLGLGAAALVITAVVMCNLWVTGSTAHKIYHDPGRLPYNEVGVVLGTSKRVADGDPNLHFRNRMAAAAQLYRLGKIDHILVSGHDSGAFYNEPRDMRAALVGHGVPESAITEDPAGLRTWNSMVRAHGAFGLSQFTVISDGFHVSRAVFIARKQGAEAVAFAAEPVDFEKSLRSRSREWLARVRAVLDVFFEDAELPLREAPAGAIEVTPRGGHQEAPAGGQPPVVSGPGDGASAEGVAER